MRRAEAGFTLIELLVAMTLLALLATIVTRALGSTNLAVGRGEERVSNLVAASDLQQLLVREIGRARPYVPDRAGRPVPVFAAEPERLRFIEVTPEGRPPPPFLLVELTIEDLAGASRLLLRKVPLTGGMDAVEAALAAAPPTVLHEGAAYRLRYYGTSSENARPGWVDSWPRTAADIPRAVALAITPAAGTALPEIVATFPVTGSAICGNENIACRLLPDSGR
ncbi:MAG TPA: prepilin-type N-terminal cleavage/methylation domain-containing protein [Geminicoccus sp.]|uniref:prepilin-type N-terminal cleavage/methylation domain-containing protein n=1 Tax=Geminicoccus sp. TaxID=2024832 RepID=UPI002E3200BA|nr:prepilin-type N-terminal cleavage/methylation domain-containing protein [Geminicoccus sp.]HEX2529770.1 prepilin-type N-terminal cleavage/methylation domain-containing protein [Geminicoccus sp.]